MKYFFEGKVKSISIENSSSSTKSTKTTNTFIVEFKNSQPTQWSDKVLCIEETTNKNKKLLLIEKLIFTIKNESLFNFISIHSKETFKVYFEEMPNNGNQLGKGNTNIDNQADKVNPNSKIKYEIKKVELIYG